MNFLAILISILFLSVYGREKFLYKHSAILSKALRGIANLWTHNDHHRHYSRHLLTSSINQSMSFREGSLPLLALSSSERGQVGQQPSSSSSKFGNTAKLLLNLSIWYTISAMYNIYNKKALNALHMPWTVALIQLGGGLLLFIPLWLIRVRTIPFDNSAELFDLFWSMKGIGLFATIAHISGVMALGLGTVSFTQVVKASEPLFTAATSGLFLHDVLPLKSYLSLIPVMVGVCMSSVSELTFSWQCLVAGVMSNTFSALRSVYSKIAMCGDIKCTEISAENFYSVLTLLCFLMLIPVTLVAEWSQIGTFYAKWSTQALAASEVRGLWDAVISGILFYLYNELSFKVLSEVNPVTHALANTMKRVVIILSSVFVFRNPLTTAGKLGSALAMLGTFLYSLSRR